MAPLNARMNETPEIEDHKVSVEKIVSLILEKFSVLEFSYTPLDVNEPNLDFTVYSSLLANCTEIINTV